MERIVSCRVCGAGDIREFFDLGDQPFANALLKSPADPDPKYPLSLSWCGKCNLVQLNHVPDPKELFSEYVWVTGTSKTAQAHAGAFCEELVRRTSDLPGSYVLEVASNDGTFLRPFQKKGYTVLGVDPASNIVEVAVQEGIPTQCAFFGDQVAQAIVKEYGKAHAVFARNVLPHVANTHDFVRGLATVLSDDGVLAIECHYAKVILDELHYDSIYHEHLCYFTVKSLEYLMRQYGLSVVDITTSPISGGSIIVYASKQNGQVSTAVEQYRYREDQDHVNSFERWEEFAKRSFAHRDALRSLIGEFVGSQKTIAGWGASARSSTLLNFCGIDTNTLPMIADKNPMKQKKYTAGTHIIIDAPEVVLGQKPDAIVILAWNFAKEIMDELRDRYQFKGPCVVPLPNQPRLAYV